MNTYAKELSPSEFEKLKVDTQVYYSVKVLEEILNDAHNARFMLGMIDGMKGKKELPKTFKFARKSFLTQYILSLSKLLEGESARKNFSIPQLNKLVKKRLNEIQKLTPLSQVWKMTTPNTIQGYETKLSRHRTAQNALFSFRGNEAAHTNIEYILNQQVRKKDIQEFLTSTTEIVELCDEIISFYLKAFGEEPQSVPQIASELKGLELIRSRQSETF